jgi:hypothetical protein
VGKRRGCSITLARDRPPLLLRSCKLAQDTLDGYSGQEHGRGTCRIAQGRRDRLLDCLQPGPQRTRLPGSLKNRRGLGLLRRCLMPVLGATDFAAPAPSAAGDVRAAGPAAGARRSQGRGPGGGGEPDAPRRGPRPRAHPGAAPPRALPWVRFKPY